MQIEQIREHALYLMDYMGYKVSIIDKDKTYYLWCEEDDNPRCYTVTNFYINKCKGWRFGLWIIPEIRETEIEYRISFFAEYEKTIDKFKPSDVRLCETWVITEEEALHIDEKDGHMFWQYVHEMIELIQFQPFIAFYLNRSYDRYPAYNGDFILFFIRDRIDDITWNFRKDLDSFKYSIKKHFIKIGKNIKSIFKK